MNPNARPVRLLMAAVALIGATLIAVAVPAPAHAATATVVRSAVWSSGYVATVTVTNDTSAPTTSWRVEFDLPPGTTIPNHWMAQLSIVGINHYVFTNQPWNGSLPPGASTAFGFQANGLGAAFNCLVNGAPCGEGGGEGDTQPPSTPGNLRITTVAPVFTLGWDPSTDNVGVTGYEVRMNGGLLANTTATSFSMQTPPPMIITSRYGRWTRPGTVRPPPPSASARPSLDPLVRPHLTVELHDHGSGWPAICHRQSSAARRRSRLALITVR
jgi:hypothetical protein